MKPNSIPKENTKGQSRSPPIPTASVRRPPQPARPARRIRELRSYSEAPVPNADPYGNDGPSPVKRGRTTIVLWASLTSVFGCRGDWMSFMTTPRTSDSLGNQVAREVFTGLPRRYDRLSWLLSFGQDRRWRRSVVEGIAAGQPRRVLDVATGPAGGALAVARRTEATVVGVDLNEPMLRRGLRNVQAADRPGDVGLVAGRAEQLPFRDECFDAICFSYLLRYVDEPAAAIVEMTRCLRPGGRMASLEFFVPPAAGWRAAWRVYVSAVLPLAGW